MPTFFQAYIANEDEIESVKATKQKNLRDLQKQIVDVRPRNGNDFESLTALYRQIFKYLMTHRSPPLSSPHHHHHHDDVNHHRDCHHHTTTSSPPHPVSSSPQQFRH
jgi:hypothetical protein